MYFVLKEKQGIQTIDYTTLRQHFMKFYLKLSRSKYYKVFKFMQQLNLKTEVINTIYVV